MGWLDALERRAREAVGSVPPKPSVPARVQAKPEIQSFWMQTAAARLPDFPGAAEPVFYFVSNGVVMLCDESGKSTGKAMALGPNDPQSIASILRRANTNDDANFNRRLNYRPLGIV
jgi:hypothetical protein